MRIPPGRGMARHVELGNNADAAVSGILHHIANFLPGVLLLVAVGAMLWQLREGAAGYGEGLVLCQVPVEHIELGVLHGIQEGLHLRDGLEMPAGVDEQPPVREPWRILDMQRQARHGILSCGEVETNQLRQRLQTVQSAPHGLGRNDRGSINVHVQHVGLIHAESKVRGGILDVHYEAGIHCRRMCGGGPWEKQWLVSLERPEQFDGSGDRLKAVGRGIQQHGSGARNNTVW
mmetsp:Transcript_36102/g.75230  ORF Transcript_36102/g.75230 Transcript_36102/m.75230 type:complete len:233 (+) Transcript_36102:764-1462(+)